MNTSDTFTRTDGQFFRIVQSLFPPAFLFGAGVLLASYDEDEPLYDVVEQVHTTTVVSAVRV